MDRVYTTTNPYRPGDTPALTTYLYDSLGRPLCVTTPDGAITAISHSGNVSSIADPAGNTKNDSYDAAGRLYNVLEDPGTGAHLNQTTDYRYDALDNLLLVSQGYCNTCQQRHFVYDALSRLTQSVNPESGSVNYTYDPNGNLQTRSDARGITATYGYDALSRLVSKNYSDSTPAVAYTYGTSVPE